MQKGLLEKKKRDGKEGETQVVILSRDG